MSGANLDAGLCQLRRREPSAEAGALRGPTATGTLNHVGVERTSVEEVHAEADRLEAAGLTLDVEGDVVCCHARQDKHWVTGPDTQRWENYVVLADAQAAPAGTESCCA